MSENAQVILRELGEKFAEAGFPPYQGWSFSPEGEEAALGCRELAARGYLERDPRGWRLSATGAAHVLSEHPMTTGAQEALARIRTAYVEHGYPNHRTWYQLPANKEEKALFVELWTRGFLQPRDISHTRWGLTDAGQQAIMRTI